MKRAILLLALCALPLLAAATLRGQPRKLEDADGVCKFNVEVDECDFDNVEALVEDPDCETDTFSLSDIRRDINRECRRARRRADKGEKLEDLIPEFDRQDLKNYFNGGTYWNENTGVVDNEAPIIEELYDDFAQEATMRYPNYISNFAQCDMAVMCLWIRDRQPGDDNGNCERPLGQNCVDADPADNTDVCYADASRMPEAVHVPEGRAFFPDDTEGDTHAHGFAFKRNSLSNRFKGNLLFYISMYDHLSQRGYAENLPLAPMCGCLDKMPSVSRADCTEVDVAEVYNVQYDASAEEDALTAERTEVEIEFNACDGATANDLYSELAQLYGDDLPADVRKYLVGPEDNDEPSNCPANADELDEGSDAGAEEESA